jgi:sec-independent protein translocase protein TatB
VFGLSFGELVVLLLVAVVVLGPKELPRYLRKAGQLAGQLRRLAYDMRAKSGIDEVLRSEGIGADIAEIRRLATFARGELGGIVSAVRSAANGASLQDVPASPYAQTQTPYAQNAQTQAPYTQNAQAQTPYVAPAAVAAAGTLVQPDRAREYPTGGPDSYGALPEGSNVYEGDLPHSPLAEDGLYARGESDPRESVLESARESEAP